MGYNIHITRQENWFDKDENKKISLIEWKGYLLTDSEMRLDNYAEATTSNGEGIQTKNDGLSVWTAYSGSGKDGNEAWFDYNNGNIVVKNPDDEILNKIVSIAERLKAIVQGDEGEVYERTSKGTITSNA